MDNDTLTNFEVQELSQIGSDIKDSLECDANGTGLPCRTDRMEAVNLMRKYLKIHGYKVLRKDDVEIHGYYISQDN